ncbi:unnamed protein product [Symbiodinium sp. KB8]|nr:unnamed protein product [Symbiodinium sp. KB8]
MSVARQTTAEMDWCRVVGPRGLCGPLDEMQRFPTSNLRAWSSGDNVSICLVEFLQPDGVV